LKKKSFSNITTTGLEKLNEKSKNITMENFRLILCKNVPTIIKKKY